MSARKDPVEVVPSRGWGEAFQDFFDPRVRVRNYAVGGRSSRSYLTEGRWEKVQGELTAGDYVLIQFGHNDRHERDPRRFTNPTTAYCQNLVRYVKETREKGATPILLTSIAVRNFNEYGVLIDTHGLYPLVVRQVAKELDVALIDHLAMSEAVVIGLGTEESKRLFNWVLPGQYENYPEGLKDNTHLSLHGAQVFASLVASELTQFDLSLNRFNLINH
ncbi:UNVERIFIED_CONTAM: hypothetical protein GTU68_038076 [Idotea baltica]|nr:hypothetical protein [Idotea baltica]